MKITLGTRRFQRAVSAKDFIFAAMSPRSAASDPDVRRDYETHHTLRIVRRGVHLRRSASIGRPPGSWTGFRHDQRDDPDARRRETQHQHLRSEERRQAIADHTRTNALQRPRIGERLGAGEIRGPGRWRLHLRLSGHSRALQIRRPVRDDAVAGLFARRKERPGNRQ